MFKFVPVTLKKLLYMTLKKLFITIFLNIVINFKKAEKKLFTINFLYYSVNYDIVYDILVRDIKIMIPQNDLLTKLYNSHFYD